jgi:YebC/PmpR family DNA-binding regulatory protein
MAQPPEETQSRDLGLSGRIAQSNQKRIMRPDGTLNVVRLGHGFWQSLNVYQHMITVTWPRFFLYVLAFYIAANAIFASLYIAAGPGAIQGGEPNAPWHNAIFFSVQTIATIEEFVYEGYGPGGAAVMVKVATDNKNRTVSDIRHVFSKNGGNMAEPGAVAWMFEMKSNVVIEGEAVTEEKLMDVALEAGAEDIRNNGDSWQVISDPSAHQPVLDALAAAGIPVSESEATALVPKNTVNLEGKDATAMMKLFDALDDHDDVQNVYGNFDISDDEAVDA